MSSQEIAENPAPRKVERAKRPDRHAHRRVDSHDQLTQRHINFIIIGLMSAMFLSSLNQTVVGTAMKSVADDLNGQSQQAWVTTAFLIVSTVVTPIYGKLSDLFGRRPLFLVAIVIFSVGSVGSGFSHSMIELAGWRALQGLGAGGLMSLPMAVIGDIVPPRERAKYQGYFLAVFGVSSILGPLIGGLFAGIDELWGISGWRYVFFVNVPFAILALVLVYSFLHLPKSNQHPRIDWWGAATVVLAVVPLMLVAEQGREWGWTSGAAWLCYVLSAVGVILFVVVERIMGKDALIPLSMFRSPAFSTATVLSTLTGFGMFGAMMSIPLLLQIVMGATPTESGLYMIPMILGLMTASIVSGIIVQKTGKYGIFPVLGTGLLAIGFFYMTFITADKPLWWIFIGMVIIGLGLGQLMQTLVLATQNAVDVRLMGVASSSSVFFRQIGGTLGTAVIFSGLFTSLPDNIKAAGEKPENQQALAEALKDPSALSDPKNATVLELFKNAKSDPNSLGGALNSDTSWISHSDHRFTQMFLDGFASSIAMCFVIALCVILVAFVITWFFRVPPLRQRSGLEEVAARPQTGAIDTIPAGEQAGEDASRTSAKHADTAAGSASASAGSAPAAAATTTATAAGHEARHAAPVTDDEEESLGLSEIGGAAGVGSTSVDLSELYERDEESHRPRHAE